MSKTFRTYTINHHGIDRLSSIYFCVDATNGSACVNTINRAHHIEIIMNFAGTNYELKRNQNIKWEWKSAQHNPRRRLNITMKRTHISMQALNEMAHAMAVGKVFAIALHK